MEMRGVAVTPGYWQRDDLTGEPFTKDGRLRTGDVGHPGEGGFVHITGRIKEIIIRSGENVAAPAAPDCPRTATGATGPTAPSPRFERRQRLRPRRTAGGCARGYQSTTGGRSWDTAGGPACPYCSAGTANAWRNSSWCFGTRRSGRGGCTGGTGARHDDPDRQSDQSATRFTVRSGSTPALTSSS